MRTVTFICLLGTVGGSEIDNGVTGTPKIDCQEGHVDFSVQTQKPFVGRIYTEGFQGREGCGVEAFSPMGTTVSLRIKTQDCGMQMERMTEPIIGMAFTVNLIVSFHGVFITKVDRAYAIQCYFEQEKALVSSDIDISAIPATEITGVDMRKQCTYTIHAGSENGPVARFATVGQALWHRWECNDKSKGILIHTCKGTDGRGKEFHFYDERGCSVDPVIMPQIQYAPGSRSASVESHAFKFSDRESLHLECLVSSCTQCQGITPPNCGRLRVKRNASEERLAALPEGTHQTLARLRIIDLFDEEGQTERRGAVCLLSWEAASFVSVTLGLALVALIATIRLLSYRKRQGSKPSA